MTQKAPNPVELYKGAVQRLIPILAGVKPEQLGDATPCSEWNVQQLMIHTIKAPYRIHGIITGGEYPDINAVDDPIPPEGALAAYEHRKNLNGKLSSYDLNMEIGEVSPI